METTPCGLLKFNNLDSYNFRDAEINFERPDELLARLGAHESRFFDHSGTDKLATLGVVVDSRWNITAFDIVGMGEWYFVYVAFNPKADVPRAGSKNVISMPAVFSAMHTQKLGSMANGRGVGGWISSTGVVNIGTTSGTDSTLQAGESLQLCGWYLPKNEVTTIGIPTIGDKAPFYSNYINSLDIIDKACKDVNTNTLRQPKDYALSISGNTAKMGTETIFTGSSSVQLTAASLGEFNDFVFIGLTFTTKSSISISTTGDIGNVLVGTINAVRYHSLRPSPLDNSNSGRIQYSYVNFDTISIAAMGRAGGTGSITVPVGTTLSIAGYYRKTGT